MRRACRYRLLFALLLAVGVGCAQPVPGPGLNSISPSSSTLGATVQVTLTGTGFIAGGTTVNAPQGITVSNVIVMSSTQLTATFRIGACLSSGTGPVTVTTQIGASNSVSFGVLPTLSSITPNTGAPGANVPVTLTGACFVVQSPSIAFSGPGTTINAPPGITVSNVSVGSTQITATFGIAATAPTGSANVTVSTAAGMSNATPFTIGSPAPTLGFITPNSGAQGTMVPVTLAGSGFVAGGTTVSAVLLCGAFCPAGGITVDGVNVTSSTQLTATFTILNNTPPGPANVTVTTAAGSSGSVTFTVNAGIPTLASISPNSGSAGSSVPVTLSGANFVPNSTVAVSNNGIAVSNVNVVSATQMTATFSIGASASGSANVTVTTSGGTSTPAIFTINAVGPTIQVSPLQLSFRAVAGGDTPPAQNLAVLSTGSSAVNFKVSVDSSWLKTNVSAGVTPARLVVSVDQGSMAAGTYTGKVQIATQPPNDVPVSLTVVNADPALDVSPTLVRVSAHEAAPGTSDSLLVLRNSGGGSITFSASAQNGTWLTQIASASGQITPNNPAILTLHVDTHGLAAGGYRDVVHITSSAGTKDVPVSLYVAPSGSQIGVNVTGVQFYTRQSNAAPGPQTVLVMDNGDPGTVVNWTAKLISGSDWLTLTTSSGTSTPGSPSPLVLTPNSNEPSLPAGARYALIAISDPNARNQLQYVVAVDNHAPATQTAIPIPDPAGLFFNASNAAPQQVVVSTNSSTPVAFQAGTSTSDGAPWLSVAPASGTAPATLNVSVNAAGLAAGIYSGDLNIAMNGTMRTVAVKLVVPAATSASSSNAHAAGCTPSKITMTSVGTPNNFSVPAAWPANLFVLLNDDCGNAITNGSVVASFPASSDAPLQLLNNGNGRYGATWTPNASTAQTTVNLRATAGTLQPSLATLTGAVSQNAMPPPILASGGILHNLNAVVGAPLAPNTVAQVFGTNLATNTASPGVVPLVTSFNTTTMLIGGYAVPLYYLSSNQLTVQIPAELSAPNQYAVALSAYGAAAVGDPINLNAVAPGVAQFLDGTIIAQHAADYSLVDANHPAMPGEYLIMYLSGMGPTNPSVASGNPAPFNEPLARMTIAPKVTVGGQNSDVVFAGLTPGGIGLYQIDFRVPPTITTGTVNVSVSQGTTAANTTTLPVASPH